MSRLIDADMLSPDRDYYENSYNSGYDAVSCQQIDNVPTVKAIKLDKIEKAREEIFKAHMKALHDYGWSNLLVALEILDKLIAESED